MYGRSAHITSVICSILMLASTFGAGLPADQHVTYSLFNMPGNPDSGVAWTVTFNISADSRIDNIIHWRVNAMTVTAYLSDGEHTWLATDPNVQTLDGLWTVAHANGDSPCDTDHWDLPYVTSVLAPQTTGDSSLGCAIWTPPSGIPWMPTVGEDFTPSNGQSVGRHQGRECPGVHCAQQTN